MRGGFEGVYPKLSRDPPLGVSTTPPGAGRVRDSMDQSTERLAPAARLGTDRETLAGTSWD